MYPQNAMAEQESIINILLFYIDMRVKCKIIPNNTLTLMILLVLLGSLKTHHYSKPQQLFHSALRLCNTLGYIFNVAKCHFDNFVTKPFSSYRWIFRSPQHVSVTRLSSYNRNRLYHEMFGKLVLKEKFLHF